VKVRGSKAVLRMAPGHPIIGVFDCTCLGKPGAGCVVTGQGGPILMCIGETCCTFTVLLQPRFRLSGITRPV
jgi:hypothetical protein